MNTFTILLIILLLIPKSYNSVIRQTQYGLVRGELKTSTADSNVKYYSFLGVPYAEPPLKKLRFKEAVPPKPWDDVRNATTMNACVQMSNYFMTKNIVGSEDCLQLEISEPLTARNGSKRLLPVYFYIHGGTFIAGSAYEDGPEYFMEHPIVFVSVHYRLNVFGFLTTNDQYAPENVGLKDQLFALEWVHRNIKSFGGDPTKVTIGGCSAGASSAQYLFLNPRAQHLFRSVIFQSGSTINQWALQRNPLEMTEKLAKGLGVESKNNSELVSYLQDLDYKVLLKAIVNESIMGRNIYFYAQPFAPIIEKKSVWAFADQSMYSLLENQQFRDIPVLTGYATEEGSFPYEYCDNGVLDINIYDTNPELIVSSSFNIPSNSECNNIVLNSIRQYYFNNGSFTNKTNWINFMSEDIFVRAVMKAASFILKKSTSMYVYTFSFKSTDTTSYLDKAGHCNELMYLHNERDLSLVPKTANEKLMQKKMTKMWANFIFTGNPTPKSESLLQNVIWPKYDENKFYLNIDQKFSIKQEPDKRHVDFWNHLFKICGFPPFYTY